VDTYDLVLTGGRVIDPETGLDDVRNVAVDGDRIAAVAAEPLEGRVAIDVSGHVVCPGFIDLHSHAQSTGEHRLRALDGVTTALELEAGITPVQAAYERMAQHGRPLNYGFSASWALARMAELAGVQPDGTLGSALANLGNPAWQKPASAKEVAAILDRLADDLSAGAIGIGILAGYAPLIDPTEYLSVAELASRAGAPTFTHARELIEANPNTPIDGASEIVQAAAETGAHMHYCHINSTSTRRIDRVQALVEKARAEGSRVTTEAYPYGAGSTAIGATFLDPSRLGRMGIRPDSIMYVPKQEWIASAERLAELRASDPGGLVILKFLDEDDPVQRAFLERALTFEDAAVASDAMPLTWTTKPPAPMTWPLPPGAVVHPRTAGTYAKTFRTLVRERGLLTLPEAVRRCTLVPAQVLEASVPAMRRKGRIQPGADADVVVFDPERIADRATYTHGTLPSTGIPYVLVNGTFLVRDGQIVPGALAGRPVRAGA
jgi:N-acyl-D-aspartate/D-glutamate deacylase